MCGWATLSFIPYGLNFHFGSNPLRESHEIWFNDHWFCLRNFSPSRFFNLQLGKTFFNWSEFLRCIFPIDPKLQKHIHGSSGNGSTAHARRNFEHRTWLRGGEAEFWSTVISDASQSLRWCQFVDFISSHNLSIKGIIICVTGALRIRTDTHSAFGEIQKLCKVERFNAFACSAIISAYFS